MIGRRCCESLQSSRRSEDTAACRDLSIKHLRFGSAICETKGGTGSLPLGRSSNWTALASCGNLDSGSGRECSALLKYKTKYGHCDVPAKWPENPKLGLWVTRQRSFRRRGIPAHARIARLDSIGFDWGSESPPWESKYAALVEYQRAHGHCRISTLDPDYAPLGNWVRTQRVRRRKGALSAEQIQRLDDLGFVWDLRTNR